MNLLALPAKFFAALVNLLPIKVQLFLGDCIGFIWFDLFRLRRKIIMENLDLAFPDMDRREKTRIGRQSCFNLGRGLLEFARIPFLRRDKASLQQFEIFGREHLEAALAKGKGACLVSLHLGNGDFGVAGLAINDIKIHIISKLFKVPWINSLWFGLRTKLGTQFIPPQNSTYAIIRALKKNQPVCFVQDQYMTGSGGIEANFFGHPAKTAMGLALISMRTGAPVLPVYSYRKEDGVTAVGFEGELNFTPLPDKEEMILHITQKCNDKLEELVRQRPEQWMWVHRRWKNLAKSR